MKYLRHNLGEKALAFALTFLLFYTVDRAQTPARELSFSKRLVYENIPKGLKVVANEPPLIRLTVRGDARLLDAITRSEMDQVTVSVRLDHAERGTSSYPVFLSLPPNLQEQLNWQASPSRLDVTLVAETDITVPVVAVPIGPLPAGQDKSDWVAEPEQVIVSGNERDVERVATARIRFDPTDTSSASELRPIELVSRSGVMVRGDLTVSPSKGRVVPASGELRTKWVAVAPRWKGRLPFGYRLAGFRVNPGQIVVRGPGIALAKLEELVTEPIDLWDITSTRTISVPIAAPVGITVVGDATVEVRVEVEQTEGPE